MLYNTYMCKYKDLLQGYKSYVLPLVTYCSSVWSPSCKNDIAKVESVQKYFSKNIRQCKFLPYLERLKFLDLPTLEKRRLWADLILCYKILNGQIAGPPERYGSLLNPRQSRGHSKKLWIQQSHTDIRKNSFACRICECWNSLPPETINCNILLSFKTKIKECNLDRFLVLKTTPV